MPSAAETNNSELPESRRALLEPPLPPACLAGAAGCFVWHHLRTSFGVSEQAKRAELGQAHRSVPGLCSSARPLRVLPPQPAPGRSAGGACKGWMGSGWQQEAFQSQPGLALWLWGDQGTPSSRVPGQSSAEGTGKSPRAPVHSLEPCQQALLSAAEAGRTCQLPRGTPAAWLSLGRSSVAGGREANAGHCWSPWRTLLQQVAMLQCSDRWHRSLPPSSLGPYGEAVPVSSSGSDRGLWVGWTEVPPAQEPSVRPDPPEVTVGIPAGQVVTLLCLRVRAGQEFRHLLPLPPPRAASCREWCQGLTCRHPGTDKPAGHLLPLPWAWHLLLRP